MNKFFNIIASTSTEIYVLFVLFGFIPVETELATLVISYFAVLTVSYLMRTVFWYYATKRYCLNSLDAFTRKEGFVIVLLVFFYLFAMLMSEYDSLVSTASNGFAYIFASFIKHKLLIVIGFGSSIISLATLMFNNDRVLLCDRLGKMGKALGSIDVIRFGSGVALFVFWNAILTDPETFAGIIAHFNIVLIFVFLILIMVGFGVWYKSEVD